MNPPAQLAPWTWFVPLAAGLFGLCIGSFLNVVIHRLPLGLSIVQPGSRCPGCERPIRWFENIPLLSWLVLRGRCRGCAAPISVRYPAVELLTGLLFAAVAWLAPGWVDMLAGFVFVAMLVALAGIDLDHFILPDVLTLPLVPIGAVYAFVWLGRPLPALALDILVGPAFLLSLRWGYKWWRGIEGLGLGDVKLMAGIGAFLGWRGVLGTCFAGSFVGAVTGLVLMAARGGDLRLKLPFGPFLVGGALLWLLLDWAGLSVLLLPALEP